MVLSPPVHATVYGDPTALAATTACADSATMGAVLQVWEAQGVRALSAHQRHCLELLAQRGVTPGPWTDRLRALDPDAADAVGTHLAEVHRQTPTQRLEDALCRGDAVATQTHLLAGGDPNSRVRRPGRTAVPLLAAAALAGRPDLVTLLCRYGATPSPAVADALIAGLESSQAHESLAVRLGRRMALVRLQELGQRFDPAQVCRMNRVGTELLTFAERVQVLNQG